MDSIFLVTIFLLFYICDSKDTITSTQYISDANNDTLLSSNGDFRLGFFSTGKTSPNRYLGIWFNKIPVKNIVWIANRDDPVMTKDGVFKINGDGNIMIFSDKNATVPLWSSNMSSDISITNPTAKLLDSGNFELTAMKGSDSRKRVWQSFDHPTDTLLPGMKLGLDKKTGLNKVLTSWLSNNDPGHGEYSMEVETNGVPQFFLRQKNSESPLSRIGPWNGVTLSGTPILANRLRAGTQEYYKLASLFNFTYVDNDNEVCLILTVPDPGNFRTLVVEFQGTEQQSFWRSSSDKSNKTGEWAQFWYSPSDSCDIYMRCGKNTICNPSNSKDIDCACLPGYEPNSDRDWTLNCNAKSEYQKLCGKGDGEGFVALVSMKLPDSRNANYIANVSLKECELECLKSCNCTGYASADIKEGGKGCYVWEGALNDVRKYPEDGQDFYLRVDSVQLAISKKSNRTNRKKRIPSVVIVLIVVFGVFLVLTCCFYAFRKRTARKGQRQKQIFREMILADSDVDAITDSTKANNFADSDNIDLTFFDLDIILKATVNFSPAKRLGQGSFGPVYKGELPNGHYIAVKRLSKTSSQGISEFKNEALLIAKLQHRNLVRLVGCCIDEGEKMLVYEYMPNKSLDYFIFDESKKSMLNWRKRHEIIVGIARGILYLHQDSRLKIIHRDLKASNILLDIDLNPKISDFGTARIFGGNQVEENTNRVVGTFGYMSPEYALDGCFSVKSDVFSFGVLLLEIISGKKNNRFLENIPNSSLIKHVWELWSNDKGLEMVDILILEDTISADEVMRCIQVGLLCVQDNAADRPTMSTVIFMLSNEATLPSPKQPMAAVYRENDKTDTTSNATRSSSVNGITVTELGAR